MIIECLLAASVVVIAVQRKTIKKQAKQIAKLQRKADFFKDTPAKLIDRHHEMLDELRFANIEIDSLKRRIRSLEESNVGASGFFRSSGGSVRLRRNVDDCRPAVVEQSSIGIGTALIAASVVQDSVGHCDSYQSDDSDYTSASHCSTNDCSGD